MKSSTYNLSDCIIVLKYVMHTGLGFCDSYNVDVEKFTEMWLTFCINNNDDIDPTLEGLIKMENIVLKTKSHDISKENNTNQEQTTVDKEFIESATFLYPLIFYKVLEFFLRVKHY